MTKLLLLDKDGTLVRPKSGGEFVQHPEDQELLPGVAEAIARYADDGWTMAIVTNQDGVAARECLACQVPVGSHIESVTTIGKVKWKSTPVQEGGLGKIVHIELANGSRDWFPATLSVTYRYKTLNDAIAEMQFALKLLPQISAALFCPDMEGQECYHVGRRDDFVIEAHEYWRADLRGFYRKPNKGMVELARWQIHSALGIVNPPTLMIGDRPEDQQAAIAANIPFMWANEWRQSPTTTAYP